MASPESNVLLATRLNSVDSNLCSRCGMVQVIVHELGHERSRCPAPSCEEARRHRRAQQNASHRRVKLGPLAHDVVEEKQAYYAPGGEGWPERRDEALRVLHDGGSLKDAADAVLMPVQELRQALGLLTARAA